MLNAGYASAEMLFRIPYYCDNLRQGGVRSDFAALQRVPAVIVNNIVVSVRLRETSGAQIAFDFCLASPLEGSERSESTWRT